jgi:crotonobetainyl-CoA:carnitine CoA-transferase CaiB-like acyl-CoA transferase
VLHNFTSGSREAKALDYESLKKVNPTIILISISGFGMTGPYAGRPAFDSIAQALCGGMSYTGFPGSPPVKSAVNWVDYSTAIHAALGIMLALYHRAQTGKGQMIDLAMLDVAVAALGVAGVAAEYKLNGTIRQQIGNNSFYNFSNSFQSKDGWVMISAPGEALWRRLLETIGREDLKDDPRFKDDTTRGQNRDIIEPIVSEWTKERTTKEILEKLMQARVPCDQINNVAQMFDHPQVKARETLVNVEYPEIGKVPLTGITIKMSETPGTIERRAPKVGEHNQEVYLKLLGLAPEELSRLQAEGVI